ncbi:MAG: ATP-grasp domain-containing protein [Bryobacteraceae bacterium]
MYRRKILIVASTTGYQTSRFAEAARRLGVESTLATDRCHVLDDPWGDRALPVRFEAPEESVAMLGPSLGVDGIVAVGDRPAYLASRIAERFGLPFHPSESMAAARNKFLARERFRVGGLPVPVFRRVPLDVAPAEAAASTEYPCVLKPLGLSASRGVIRANDPGEFVAAFDRIRAILQSPEIERLHDEVDRFIQVERYIPGREFAVEGLMTRGKLRVLAVFDKPDPLEGPYFEETIYVTPSREPAARVEAIHRAAERAAAALGLRHGPVHAEMRVNEEGVWMLEVAGRPIGGLCAKALRFQGGMPLEELIVRHALGENVSNIRLENGAAGVMMIPIPRGGVYRTARGLVKAEAVLGIEEVTITAKEGQLLRPLPEGQSYLGFLFARGQRPEAVEDALREAHRRLDFEIATSLL